MVTALAPGKIILFGEHAVVYGHPAIAVPLSAIHVSVNAHPTPEGRGLTIRAPDVNEYVCLEADSALEYVPGVAGGSSEAVYDALVYPVRIALDAMNRPLPDAVVSVRSTIPIASGLGSGAALATAMIRAIGALAGHPFDLETLNALVFEVEKKHHGTPSGIDNTVIVYEKPVYFQRTGPNSTIIEPFSIPQPFTLLVADTGRASPTRLAVADVRRLYDADPALVGATFARIGAIVGAARHAIVSGAVEALGSLMDENHALLRDLTVSSDALERLCEVARAAGAWGAKLSGGGRGGNMIALVAPNRAVPVRDALLAAGASNVIRTTVG